MTHGLFIRPATGDVIAHFAKIDGEFIAVSSLNHEVYKGKNVRQIVDRMLALIQLPSKIKWEPPVTASNSGDLGFLLRPILTIDGVVAAFESILEGASASIEEDRGGLWLLSSILKSEPLKNIFDTSVSNYNVSVLVQPLHMIC